MNLKQALLNTFIIKKLSRTCQVFIFLLLLIRFASIQAAKRKSKWRESIIELMVYTKSFFPSSKTEHCQKFFYTFHTTFLGL